MENQSSNDDQAVGEAPAADDEQDESKAGSDGAVDAAPDADHWRSIVKARDDERAREGEVNELSEDLKEAKKRYESASNYLGRLIDEAKFPTLFTKRADHERIVAAQEPFPVLVETDGAEPAAPEAWRSVVIADLQPALKPGKLKALAENNPPIVTIGDMSEFIEKHGEWWWKNIKGFGDGGQEQYVAACEEYFKAHPQQPAGENAAVMREEVA